MSLRPVNGDQPTSAPAAPLGAAAPAPTLNLCRMATNFFMGRATAAPQQATKKLKGSEGQAESVSTPASKASSDSEEQRATKGIRVPSKARRTTRNVQVSTTPATIHYPTVPQPSTERPELEGIRKRKGRDEDTESREASPEPQAPIVINVRPALPESNIWDRLPNLNPWGNDQRPYPDL